MILGSCWVNFWSSFPNFLKTPETLKNVIQCETTVFEYPGARLSIIFPSIFQDKFYSQHFIEFWSTFGHLGTPFGDLWLHFWRSLFQVAKKSKGFCSFALLGWGYLRPRREKKARWQRRPGGGTEGKRAKPIMFFCQKWRDRPFHVRRSVVTLTKSAACA